MNLQTISQVSRVHGVSLRMLRYYEKEGLLESKRKADYAYRVYDEMAINRLRQIIILRKLRVPVKQIKAILENQDASAVIELFQQNINELDDELTALSTIKKILQQFVDELRERASIVIHLDALGDSMLSSLDTLSFTKHQIKESLTMDALDKASDVLNKLTDVRIVYLPPMTFASIFCNKENPEEKAWQAMQNFLQQSNMPKIKPDLRCFMLGHSNATGQSFGHEILLSIPEDFVVPAPFVKKTFRGGMYVAHFIVQDGIEPFLGMQDWVNESENYQYDCDLTRFHPPIKEIDSFGGIQPGLEEVLNIYNFQNPRFKRQMDALFPIKEYTPAKETAPVEIPDSQEKCGYKASLITRNKFKIMGFTKIISGGVTPQQFEEELTNDGRLAILNKFRKNGAPLLCFGSYDMDSSIRGGWRVTYCLAQPDITDSQVFLQHAPYVRTIDASKWLIFEYPRGHEWDGHDTCPKLGFTWNGLISGSFHQVFPDGKIGRTGSDTVFCWYPVK